MITTNVHSHVFFPESLVQTLQLLAEISWEVGKKENKIGVAEQISVCLIRMKTHSDVPLILQTLLPLLSTFFFFPGEMPSILWRREWQPNPVFLPVESQGQRSLVGYSPWDCKELDMTE